MKVVVVGAGIGGLASAFHLARRGHEVTVLEASGRAGGVIGTLSRDGFLLETAANGFLNREPAMLELVDALGLRERLRAADPSAKHRFIYTRGAVRPVPSSPPAFLKTDLVSFGTKLRMAGDLFASRAKVDDESLASFARRHIGADATAILIDAVQTGIFAGDVEKLSVNATFPRMVELEQKHRSLVLAQLREGKALRAAAKDREARGMTGVLTTFDGGMQTLIDALVKELGPRIAFNTAATALEREANAWRVRVRSRTPGGVPEQLGGKVRTTGAEGAVAEEDRAIAGEPGELVADHVVLACPAPAAATLLRPLAPAVSDEVSEIPYAAIAAVHVGWRALPNPPVGFGFLIPSAEQRKILGALYVSSFFPHRAPPGATLLTVMVGGARHPEHVALDDRALTELVREELAATLGISAPPDLVHVVRWPRGIPQYEVGHLARMARIEAAVAQLPGLHLAGNPYRGVSVLDAVKNAAALQL